MRPTWLTYLLMLGLLAAAASGCQDDSQAAGGASGPKGYPYRVVCTVGMVADVVRNVAGDKAQVTALLPEGSDPHQYTPTRNDVVALRQADVVFYNGLMLEGRMTETLAALGGKAHALAERLDKAQLLGWSGEGKHHDPHVWMDPRAWARTADVVAAALSAFDPANAAAYRANAAAYAARLEALDAYAREALGSVPERSRVLITAHDAFNYFGRAYGIEVRGIQGISTESEAGLRDIQALVDLIVERDVKAVFVETSVSDKNVRALVEGAAARGKTVAIGGSLFSDAMGAAGTYEATYEGMIDHNVTTIARALGGKAPEKGMKGKLR